MNKKVRKTVVGAAVETYVQVRLTEKRHEAQMNKIKDRLGRLLARLRPEETAEYAKQTMEFDEKFDKDDG